MRRPGLGRRFFLGILFAEKTAGAAAQGKHKTKAAPGRHPGAAFRNVLVWRKDI
jgi:hypothetical protein